MSDLQTTGTGQPTITKETDLYQCHSCGGEVAFDPKLQVLHCIFCGANRAVEVEKRAIYDRAFDEADNKANVNWGTLKRVFHCNNCGAESIIDGESTAQHCAFCGSSHIVKYEDAAGIAPEGLIPFKVTKDTAVTNFNNWIKKRFFAPAALKSTYRKQSISGAYIPFWSYSADSISNYTAEAGTYYYETENVTVEKDGKKVTEPRKVRKTKWRRVSGNFNRGFNDSLVNASKQLKSRILGRIEPFNLGELVPYAPGFLAGFMAEKYSISLKEGWSEAQKSFARDLEREIRSHVGADEIRNLSVNTTYNNIRYKHLLLPVWISSYTFKNKVYHFMVNGQSGKINGESPVSAGKVVAVIAVFVAIIGLVIILF